MADVVLRAAEVPLIDMPPICAKTGQPASKRIRVKVTQTPWWAWFGVLGGFLVLVLLALCAGRRCDVLVPHAKGRVLRRSAAAVAVVLGLLGVMMGLIYVTTEPGLGSGAFFFANVAFLGAAGYAYVTSVATGRWVDDHHLRLTGLHPAFAAALQQVVDHRREVERRVALAGWHPDPSGEHALRYFDGVAWTEHVSGPPYAAAAQAPGGYYG